MAYRGLVIIALSWLVPRAFSHPAGLETSANPAVPAVVTIEGIPQTAVGAIGEPLEPGVYDLHAANFFHDQNWALDYSDKYERAVWVEVNKIPSDDSSGVSARQLEFPEGRINLTSLKQCPTNFNRDIFPRSCDTVNFQTEHVLELQFINGFLEFYRDQQCNGLITRVRTQANRSTCWNFSGVERFNSYRFTL